jgi:hypothetical protein
LRLFLNWADLLGLPGRAGRHDLELLGLAETIERSGLFGAIYADRAEHYFIVPRRTVRPIDGSRRLGVISTSR